MVRRRMGTTGAVAVLAVAVLAPSAAGAAPPPTAHAQAAAATAYLTIDSKTNPYQQATIGTTFIVTGTLRAGGRGVANGIVELWERPTPGTVWVHTLNTRTTASGAYTLARKVSRNAVWQTRFPGSTSAARTTSRGIKITAFYPFPAITMRGCDIDDEFGYPRRISSTMRTIPAAAGATAVLENGSRQPLGGYLGWQGAYRSAPQTVPGSGTVSATVVTPADDIGLDFYSHEARWTISGGIASGTSSVIFDGSDPDRSHWGDPHACFMLHQIPSDGLTP